MTTKAEFYIPVPFDPPDADMVKYLKSAADGEARARGGTHAVFVRIDPITWDMGKNKFAHRYAVAFGT